MGEPRWLQNLSYATPPTGKTHPFSTIALHPYFIDSKLSMPNFWISLDTLLSQPSSKAACHVSGLCSTVVSARLIGQFGRILWGETSDCAHFFLVIATENIKTVLDQKIPQINYRSAKCWLSVFEHLKKYVFSKNILKKSKKFTWITKKFQRLALSFYCTPFVCFNTVFTFYVAPSKKNARCRKFFFPYWMLWIHNGPAKY